jgi:hypothetical protein
MKFITYDISVRQAFRSVVNKPQKPEIRKLVKNRAQIIALRRGLQLFAEFGMDYARPERELENVGGPILEW